MWINGEIFFSLSVFLFSADILFVQDVVSGSDTAALDLTRQLAHFPNENTRATYKQGYLSGERIWLHTSLVDDMVNTILLILSMFLYFKWLQIKIKCYF